MLYRIAPIAMILFCQTTSAQFLSGEQVVIDKPVGHDIYIAGGTVTINAPVHGDLIVAGGTIMINDTVTQDILIAGGNVILNNVTGDDIRCAGGTIQLTGAVTGDLVTTGGRLTIGKASVISGNLLSSGGEIMLDGTVKGDIKNASGVFTLNGVAGHDLDSRGGKIVINGLVRGNSILAAEVIELRDEAKFTGDVKYWNGPGEIDFGNSLSGGKATLDNGLHIESPKWHYLGFASFLMVAWYLSASLVMLMLIQYLFGPTLKEAANSVKGASLKSLGLGFLYLAVVPIAIVILLVTVIGIMIGVLVAMLYVTILLLATIITALVIANWINNTYYQGAWENTKIVLAAFVIFVCLKLATLTPFVGPLVMLVLISMAFGGILLNVKWKKNNALALT